MCIIVAKPKGVEMPSWKILENCWEANDDGAGVAFSNGEAVHIRKGLMTFRDFKKYVTKLSFKHDIKNLDFVAHFRITSVGETTPRMTHPFRVDTLDPKQRMSVSGSGKIYAFHNGTISAMRTYSKTYSDTFLFTETILQPFFSIDPTFYNNEHFVKVLETLLDGDKLALIDKDGIKLLGRFIQSDGVYYSNSSYEGWERYYNRYTGIGTSVYGTTCDYDYDEYFPKKSSLKELAQVSDKDYAEACKVLNFALHDIYNDPSKEAVDKFAEEYKDIIDDIVAWEEVNKTSKDNQGYMWELDAYGII